MKIPGKIKKWIASRWFGFISDGKEDYFVHGSDLVEVVSPRLTPASRHRGDV